LIRTLFLQVVIELVRRRLANQGDIGELLDSLKEPAEAGEYRLRITPTPEHPDFKEAGKMVGGDAMCVWGGGGGGVPICVCVTLQNVCTCVCVYA